MRNRRKIVGGALIAAICVSGGALMTAGPVARKWIESQAASRGLEVRIGGVAPRWNGFVLTDVALRVPEIPGIDADLAFVEVGISAWLTVERVEVHGGVVRVRGDLGSVSDGVHRWRSKRNAASGHSISAVQRKFLADGIGVDWVDPNSGSELHVWGVRANLQGEQREFLVDLARFEAQTTVVELRGGRARVDSIPSTSSIRVNGVDVDSLSGTFDLTSVLSRTDDELLGARAGQAVVVPHRGYAAFKGWGPKGIQLVREMTRQLATEILGSSPLRLGKVLLVVRNRGEVLSLGPGAFEIGRTAESVTARFVSSDKEGRAPLRFSLKSPFAIEPVEAEVVGGPTSLGSLGIKEMSFGLLRVKDTLVRVDTRVVWSADGERLSGHGSAEIDGLSVVHRALSDRPVERARLGWRGDWSVHLDGSRFRLADGEFTVGSVPMKLSADIQQHSVGPSGTMAVQIPLASCQGMLDSAPQGLLPLLDGSRLDGTFSLDAKINFDARDLDDTTVLWRMTEDCRAVALPAAISTTRFKSPFNLEVVGGDKQPLTLVTGPGSLNWVPFRGISRHMETAILVCEDGRFFHHRGFDDEAIANSIKENIRTARFARGASTVSMQLAKNLYLRRQKTLSRKLQEAALTAILERALSKEEILELYLNVIEFGPGIYGIGPAAAFYFDSTAADLSLGQSLYLASILPNPWVQHFDPNGNVSASWTKYLRKLMEIANKRKRIDSEELAEGLAEQITFKVPYTSQPAIVRGDTDVDQSP